MAKTTPSSADPGRSRINFVWLYQLRWAAVFGQLATVVSVSFGYGIPVPLTGLLFIVAVTAASNLVFGRLIAPELGGESPPRWGDQGQLLTGWVIGLDLLILTGLLFFSGGWRNPFAVFYFLHLALAAVILPVRWAWGMTVFAGFCFGFLVVIHQPLAALAEPELQRRGVLVAYLVASAIIVYFVTRIHHELDRNLVALEDERLKKSRLERVEALVTLAAGAAHELSTPLSTIAVAAKELELDLERAGGDPALAEDVRLIRGEVQRCRGILEQMSANSGSMVGERLESVALPDFLSAVIAPLHADARLEIDLDEEARGISLRIPRDAFRRAIRGLIKNALDASPEGEAVRVRARRFGPRVLIEVIDRGTGMDAGTLSRAEDPFFTTKEPGRGMGLGLYLSRSVIERLEGRLEIESEPGAGTRVTVDLPLPA
ncbi:MAG: ATP-binding protein [Planctomycetota bacterium]